MGAAHVIVENLQPGHGVSLRLGIQKQVPVILVGVGLGRTRRNPDQPLENRFRPVIQRVFVKQITPGVRDVVTLQGALVELLPVAADGEPEHLAARPASHQRAPALLPGIRRAEIHEQAARLPVLFHAGGVELKAGYRAAPTLETDVIHLGTGPDQQIVQPTGKPATLGVGRTQKIHHPHLRILSGDNQGVRINGGLGRIDPVEGDQWQLQLHVLGDMDEHAGRGVGRVQGRKLLRPQVHRVRHEIFLQQGRMFLDGRDERLKHHSLPGQLLRSLDPHQPVVDENRPGGGRKRRLAAREQLGLGSFSLRPRLEVIEPDGVDRGKAPVLILPLGHR